MKKRLSFVLVLSLLLSGVALTETSYKVGSVFTLGAYEQDNNITNGKEPIEWIVLEVNNDGSLTLMSKYALDIKPYNTEYASVSWETCTLRKWLNEDFYKMAFSAQDQAKIVPVTLDNEDNPKHGTKGGKATRDKVWLLSINEVTNHFRSDKLYSFFTDNASRMCYPTEYAMAQGAYTVSGTCFWWLRSPGESSEFAASVKSNGSIFDIGNYVLDILFGAVRPVVVAFP